MALCVTPFWRTEQFSLEEEQLLDAVFRAHIASCKRENSSAVAFRIAEHGSDTLVGGIIAALATLGGPHGPIEDTYDLLSAQWPDAAAADLLDRDLKVPGFGNGFHKGVPDPLWAEVDQIIEKNFVKSYLKLQLVGNVLAARGYKLFPNPSSYTALTAIILKMPRKLSPLLFIQPRILGWSMGVKA